MVALIQDKTIHNACYTHPSGWIFVLLRNDFADNMKTDGFASNAIGEKEAVSWKGKCPSTEHVAGNRV